MGERGNEQGRASRETSKREQREQRILDAAAELLERWGYRKVTIDDIAKQARVAKGTIYLHWKTREELFVALIEREKYALLEDSQQHMEDDPDGWTLVGMIKHVSLATLKNPLMKALFLRDAEFLGELVTLAYNDATYLVQVQSYMRFVEWLRQRGLVRNDIELDVQIHQLVAISWGFILVDPLLPAMFKRSDEEMIELMAATLTRVLEPDTSPTVEQRREAAQAFKAYLKQLFELSKVRHIDAPS